MEMGQAMDEDTKQAAQEYLAAKIVEDEEKAERKLNVETAIAKAPLVWKHLKDAIFAKCKEWNAITQEETLTCKETAIGDLRVWCASRAKQMTVHFESKRLLIILKNMARDEMQQELPLVIEGYRTATGREARLTKNGQPINLDMLLLAELRVLTGVGGQRKP
jgi:hypothetical protein